MAQYQIPYVCPECNHDRWIVADPGDDPSKAVKCPNCGYEDEVRLSKSATVVHGMDELFDTIDDKLGISEAEDSDK